MILNEGLDLEGGGDLDGMEWNGGSCPLVAPGPRTNKQEQTAIKMEEQRRQVDHVHINYDTELLTHIIYGTKLK